METTAPTSLGNLLAVFSDIDVMDLEHLSRLDLLSEVGLKIIERTSVQSVEFAVTDEADDVGSEPCQDVMVLELPSKNVRLSRRDESWWIESLYQNATKAQSHGRVVQLSGLSDEIALVVPLRFTSCYGAVHVVASKAILNEPEQWAIGLFALMETLSMRQQLAKRRQLQAFYRDLVDVACHDPSEASPMVCKLWHELSGADWVWLWLHNEYSDRFELAAYRGMPPPMEFEPGKQSAAAYAVTRGRVVVARGDFGEWGKEYKGVKYQLAYANEDSDGCQAIVCVPLTFGQPDFIDNECKATSPHVCGSVCLHYRDQHASPQQPLESLLLMGQQSAQAIGNAFLEEQRRILVSLTQMAQRHLTRVSRRPVYVRNEYLSELIDLIRKSLHFRTVSIFYRRPFDEAIECIATTGLASPNGDPISQDRLMEVMYLRGQGRTGQCFDSGKLNILNPKAGDESHSPITRDIDPDTGDWVKGVVFQPISRQATGTQSSPMIGVIRCGGYQATAADDLGGRITFHPVQLQTLGFIAQQVGPMLQIFENNIGRERTISTVKHDLFTNNNMIRDASARIASDFEHGRTIREYDIKNVGVSHLMASNLIAQLDVEPGFKEQIHPEPTLIVGDILARVVNMLRHYAWHFRGMKIEYNDNIVRVIPTLMIDRALIERVIHNLLVNAVKYGTPGSTITFSARSSFDGGLNRSSANLVNSHGYFLDIENYGLGIDDKDADLVGQPNFRAENAKGVAQGIGLGLYIARKAMERHRGQLILLRRRDPTIFSMFFPKHLST